MLTLGQAGNSTGRCNRSIHNLCVACSRNYSLCNNYFVTCGAVLALGQAGSSTGRCNSLIYHLCMTGSNHTVSFIAVSANGTGISGVAIRRTSGSCHNAITVGMVVVANPLSLGVYILPHNTRSTVYSIQECTVSIFQQRRLNRNTFIFNLLCSPSGLGLRCIVGQCFRTGGNMHNTRAGRIYIGTAGSSVDCRPLCLYRTVKQHKCILQSIRLRGIITAGNIRQCFIFNITCTAAADPLSKIIENNPNTRFQLSIRSLTNIQLRTGIHHKILIDSKLTLYQIDCKVVGYREIKFSRINSSTT